MTTPPRILQIMAGARRGGAENFFMRLTSALQNAGMEQMALIRHHPAREAKFRKLDIKYHSLRFGGPLDFLTTRQIQKQCNAFAPDIALAWMNRGASVMPRGDFVKVARLGGYYNLKYYKKCDYLVGNTRGICNYLVEQGWPEERVSYLPNFVDCERMPPIDRAVFNTPQDVPLILGLGRLHKNKGFDTALHALAKIPEAHYWIAGDGPEKEALKKLCADLNLESRVRFMGWREDVPALFGAADIFLCSSRHEPLGNMLIEAWAQGVPLATVASQGPAELVKDSETGLLSPLEAPDILAESVNRLIADPALRNMLATAGFEAYQASFTKVRVVECYLSFFEKILKVK